VRKSSESAREPRYRLVGESHAGQIRIDAAAQQRHLGDGEWPDLCSVYMPVRSAVLTANQAMAGERENKVLLIGFLLKSSMVLDLIITRKS
jgi:hypothetical protein